MIYRERKTPNPNTTCKTQKDCASGYVCVIDNNSSTGTCKAGVGVQCNTNSDCMTGLVCNNKVCTNPVIPTNISTFKNITPEPFKEIIIKETPAVRLPTPKEITPIRLPTPKVVTKTEISPAKDIPDQMIRGTFNKLPKVNNYDNSTPDYEINSEGNVIEIPFEVRSKDTVDDDYITSVSTPCEQKNGVYYCRSNNVEYTSQKVLEHSSVVDVCSYSNTTIFLLENGEIICEVEGKKRYKITNNIKLNRITTFGGYLYGTNIEGRLYSLPNNYFFTSSWNWSVVNWAPIKIIHLSTTHDTSHLWVQTYNKGFLYNENGSLVTEILYKGKKRVYGKDLNYYIDIDQDKYTATLNPGSTVINNVYDAALSYYNEVVAIDPSEKDLYRGIKIVNWRPYYIRI